MITTNLTRLLVFAVLVLVLPSGVIQADQESAGPAVPSLTDIKVSFKLDPRITRGMYMGERWVSPPTYAAVKEGNEVTVEAMAEGLDAQGNRIDISPEWKAGDPAMITISPDKGSKVNLTMLKDGQSEITVAFGGVSKKLEVKARHQDNAMRVEITQPQEAKPQPETKKDTTSQREKVS